MGVQDGKLGSRRGIGDGCVQGRACFCNCALDGPGQTMFATPSVKKNRRLLKKIV